MGTATDLLLILAQVAPAVIISAGINFAVAYAMYHSQNTIYFFPFPNTIAGDLAVTNFIQGALNYLVPNAQLELDSRVGTRVPWRRVMNPPLSLVSRISSLQGRKRQAWELLLQSEDLLAKPLGPKILFKRLFFAILRGLFLSVFLFLITWSLSVAILCPIYCGVNIPNRWAPQAIKCVYGGVHALIEIPIASFLIILSIDVRNHAGNAGAVLPQDKRQRRRDDSGASAHIGHVVDADTQRLVAIDTRTNQPVSDGDMPSGSQTTSQASSIATPQQQQPGSDRRV